VFGSLLLWTALYGFFGTLQALYRLRMVASISMGFWSCAEIFYGLKSLYVHSEKEKVRFEHIEREREEGLTVEKKAKPKKQNIDKKPAPGS